VVVRTKCAVRVGLAYGHRRVGWPFGRLGITSDTVTVSGRPRSWIGVYEVKRENVIDVLISLRHGGVVVRIRDIGETMNKFVIEINRPDKVVIALSDYQYPVTDTRGPARFFRWNS
jgi:hypothetical protein